VFLLDQQLIAPPFQTPSLLLLTLRLFAWDVAAFRPGVVSWQRKHKQDSINNRSATNSAPKSMDTASAPDGTTYHTFTLPVKKQNEKEAAKWHLVV
jgi:hypothetical protein